MGAALGVLLIGGTDPSGAAGLQADWRVMAQFQRPAASVVIAVTAQSARGVVDAGVLPAAKISAQLACIDSDSLGAIKIGMLGNAEAVKAVAHFLAQLKVPAVLDPVLAASHGGDLLDATGQAVLKQDLLPLCALVTPNLPELAALTGLPVDTHEQIESAAQALRDSGVNAVLVKGGHGDDPHGCADYFCAAAHSGWLVNTRIQGGEAVRGTGCTMASIVAAQLALGAPLIEAVVIARAVMQRALRHAAITGPVGRLTEIALPDSEADLPFFLTTNEWSDKVLDRPAFASCGTSRLGIYPVVDSAAWVQRLVGLGVETIQLRVKEQPASKVEAEVIAAVAACAGKSVRLFINDDWQLAIKHGAYGVHLGQEDLQSADLRAIQAAGLRLGVSTHCYAEMARALAVKPSYIALGPIFATTSKVMPWVPQGVAAVKRWVDLLDPARPLVAIGGIDAARAKQLKQTGVGSVAMISAITDADDPDWAIRDLLNLWQKVM